MPFDIANPAVWAPVIVGAIFLTAFLRRQKHIAHPLMNLKIFSFPSYRVSFATQCLLYGCFLGMTLIIPLFVIEGGGHSTFEAGLVLLPGALAALVFEPLAGAASDRLGVRRVSLFGATCLTVGAVSMAVIPSDAPLGFAAASQFMRCMGLTTLIPTLTAWGLKDLGAAGITTDGSASMIMSRQIFAALATAIMVCLVKQFCSPGWPDLGYHLALGFSGALAIGVLASTIAFVRK